MSPQHLKNWLHEQHELNRRRRNAECLAEFYLAWEEACRPRDYADDIRELEALERREKKYIYWLLGGWLAFLLGGNLIRWAL